MNWPHNRRIFGKHAKLRGVLLNTSYEANSRSTPCTLFVAEQHTLSHTSLSIDVVTPLTTGSTEELSCSFFFLFILLRTLLECHSNKIIRKWWLQHFFSTVITMVANNLIFFACRSSLVGKF